MLAKNYGEVYIEEEVEEKEDEDDAPNDQPPLPLIRPSVIAGLNMGDLRKMAEQVGAENNKKKDVLFDNVLGAQKYTEDFLTDDASEEDLIVICAALGLDPKDGELVSDILAAQTEAPE